MNRYLTLDAMRGVAALMVATMHLGWRGGILAHAYLAVDFFFMLSGFVIAQAYEERLQADMTLGDFAWRRVCRLWPLVLLAVLVGLPYDLLRSLSGASGSAPSDLITNAAFNGLMLPSPITDGQLYPANLPAWSLLFELFANAAYAGLATRLSTRVLTGVVVGAGAALAWVAVQQGALDIGHTWPLLGEGLLRVTFGFSAGVLIYRVATPKTRRVSVFAVLLAAILAAALAFGVGSDLAFALVVGPALVVLGARFEPPRSLVSVATWLGATSYAIYILHMPVKNWTGSALAALGQGWPVQALVGIAAIAAFATAADRLWDVPIRRWLGRQRLTGTARLGST